MRKYIIALLCLLLTAMQAHADIGSTAIEFQSTSSYYNSGRSFASPRSADTYRSSMATPTGSFSSISASNFATLNGEDGEFQQSAPSIRRGRPSGGGGAIGEYEQHSPVGDVPWAWISLLAAGYAIYRRRRAGA